MKKVMFVSSKGGHFNELMQFEPLFKDYDVTIVTEAPKNKKKFKEKYKKYKMHFLLRCSNYKIVNVFKVFIDCFISLYYFIRFRPKYIVTTGAFAAGPISCIGKIFRCKIIYIVLIIRRLHNSRRGAKYVIFSILYDNSCYEIKVRGVYTASIVDLKVVKKNSITGIT